MEVDTPAAPDAEQLVNELGQVLEFLAAAPKNVHNLRKQVELMVQLGMTDEAAEAAQSTSALSFLGEELWLKVLTAKLGTAKLNLDALETMLELFAVAEEEYLSASILVLHARTLIGLAGGLVDEEGTGAALTGDVEVVEFLDTETLRSMLRDLALRSQSLVNGAQELWQLWIDWELKNLQASSGDDRAQQLEEIHQLYLEQLKVPHSSQDATASAYSTFCSEYCVDQYEQRMVKVTEVSQPAKAKWETEKRHGKTRADIDEQIVYYSSDIGQQAQLLLSYIDWETDPAAKNAARKGKGRKGPQQDVLLTRGAFERTVLLYSNAAIAAQATPETAAAYKAAEAVVWARYVDWVAENVPADDDEEDGVAKLVGRATRACPGAGELWVRRLLHLEAGKNVPAIDGAVEQAKAVIVDSANPVGCLVDILYTHASILHRRYRDLEATVEHPVFGNLIEALDLVERAHHAGDPSLRLEKFFISWAETVAIDLLPGVLEIFDAPLKSRNSSYEWTIFRANVLATHGDIENARTTFTTAIQRVDLDWPEAVYSAFEMFENVHGTLDTLTAARSAIDHEKKRLTRRREKQAAQEQAAAVAQYQAAEAAAAAAPAPVEVTEAAEPIQIDGAEVSTEVAAAAPLPVPAPAPASVTKTEPVPEVKRDRENTSVIVSGLKKGTESARLEEFFASMGKIREIVMKTGDDFDQAMVEFTTRDAVPAALEKDGKKIAGNTVSIVALWRATLWVTNFPKHMDDEAIRTMFGNYGKILDTRWPSKKYGNTRRFCYVTMESPAVAQAALSLHKFKPEEDAFPMTVLISDPTRREQRTGAPDVTVFVGGLHAKTTEGEVRHLLSEYGRVDNVRLPLDKERKFCRGFAYVVMGSPEEAKAALAANGTQYRGKGLKVELDNKSKVGAASKKEGQETKPTASEAAERRTRTVYIYDLPEGTQEGLLQQELEKIVPIKRLEVFQSSHHAAVELENQADAGTLRLREVTFKEVPLRILDAPERDKPKTKHQPAAAALAPQSSLGFVPSQRKKKGLSGGYVAPKAAVAATPSAPVAPSGGQDSFRAFMNATNDARKKGTKHALEDGEESESKKSKSEE